MNRPPAAPSAFAVICRAAPSLAFVTCLAALATSVWAGPATSPSRSIGGVNFLTRYHKRFERVYPAAALSGWKKLRIDGGECMVSPLVGFGPGEEVNHHRVTVE